MNLLYRNNGTDEVDIEFIQRMNKHHMFDKIVVFDINAKENKYDDANVEMIDYMPANTNQYEKYEDFNYITGVSKELLEKLEAYKSSALKILGFRTYDMYYGSYDILENNYLKAVKYFDYLLTSRDINMVFMAITPHLAYEYILYCVAKCKGIPVLYLWLTHISGVHLPCTGFDQEGRNMSDLLMTDKSLEKTDIHYMIDNYLERAKGSHSIWSERQKRDYRKKLILPNHYAKSITGQIIHIGSKVKHFRRIKKSDFDLLFGLIRAQRNLRGISYYNKHAVKNVALLKNGTSDMKYVVFLLQEEPEETTLPHAGVYGVQIENIKSLAKILSKYDIKVVVKEHFGIGYRPKYLYDSLRKIDNVICVNAMVDSYDILESCLAVATQTGSIITESVMKNKYVFSFARGYWNGMKNVISVNKPEDIEDGCRRILANPIPLQAGDIDKYFDAMENSCIRYTIGHIQSELISKENVLDDTIRMIADFIEQGMQNDYKYYRTRANNIVFDDNR